ncbi:hypothetical protein DFH94DRAFT_784461 [Russula ochroleuca]|uniref:Uncharacterized protein n=1 Tax=Russula ochroleuca TaxID=152965 RepID=A0A9P5JW45_9AGAM|nr:hypothetical protein DFH94DRAFT_784461 [Russula ochroleuca]
MVLACSLATSVSSLSFAIPFPFSSSPRLIHLTACVHGTCAWIRRRACCSFSVVRRRGHYSAIEDEMTGLLTVREGMGCRVCRPRWACLVRSRSRYLFCLSRVSSLFLRASASGPVSKAHARRYSRSLTSVRDK